VRWPVADGRDDAGTRPSERGSPALALGRATAPLIAAEITLTLVTISVVVAMGRLFASFGDLRTVLVAGVVAHVLAVLARRTRLGVALSLLVSALGMVLTITWLEYFPTTWYLLPTSTTWSMVGTDLADGWDAFGLVRAPTEALPGFVVAAAVAVWVAAAMSDLAAFRASSAAEALAPAGAIFLFTAVLGDEQHRTATTLGFLAASLLFVLCFRIVFPPYRTVPVGTTVQRRAASLAWVGMGVALAAVAVGLIVGPLLPGAEASPVLNVRELDGTGGGSSRITLSPLVDTRGRLVNQSDTVVFRVQSDARAFWRTTALDTFDGAVWGSQNTYDVPGDNLTASEQPPSGGLVQQTYTIEALGDIWLPAAYTPVSVEGADSRWDADSSTLITREERTQRGMTYSVTSLSPTADFGPEELLAASQVVPADVLARYTALPEDFDPRITQLATELTAGLQTSYEKALALQNWFLNNFDYSTDVAAGHGTDRMAQFLLEERVGYCEQFAGSFGAMARAVGLPTRVATGFTPGDLVDGEYVVRGEHYHAWPEVYIDGRWVYFEPTPGRGAPGALTYTGVPEQQVQSAEGTATTLDEGSGLIGGATVPDIPLEDFGDFGDDETAGADAGDSGAPRWFGRMLAAAGILMVLAAAWWIAIPALVRWRRRRRHAAARSAAEQIEASWLDLTESLATAGVEADPSETPREYADRAYRTSAVRRDQISEMARLITESRYSDQPPGDTVAVQAAELVRALEVELADATDAKVRFRRRIDPRPLLQR